MFLYKTTTIKATGRQRMVLYNTTQTKEWFYTTQQQQKLQGDTVSDFIRYNNNKILRETQCMILCNTTETKEFFLQHNNNKNNRET